MSDGISPRFAALPPEQQPLALRYYEALSELEGDFHVLSRLDVGPDLLEWVKQNHLSVLEALRLPQHLLATMLSVEDRTTLRQRLVTSFSNYAASACALRDYVGQWHQEHKDLKGINAALLALKAAPSFKVVTKLRNRMLHGAMCFAGIKAVFHTAASEHGPAAWVLLDLTDATLVDLEQASPSRGGRVSDDVRSSKDWMRPLLEESLAALLTAWNDAATAFRSEFAPLEKRRRELRTELDELAAKLNPWIPATRATWRPTTGQAVEIGNALVQATREA